MASLFHNYLKSGGIWNLKQARIAHILTDKKSYTSDDFHYLEKSEIPTMHFQKSLPRLPIPPLEKTCERYLNSQKPLLTEEQFKQTESIVKSFQNKEGKALHEELVQRDKKNKSTSYISKPWFDMYLKSRDSIVVNVNPFMALNDDPKAKYMDQSIRASNLLISSLRFLRSLRSNLLYPEIYHLNPTKSDTESFRKFMRYVPNRFAWHAAVLWKAFPLDMSQYEGLFNATRVPKLGKDEILRDPAKTHMLVLRNGNFYVFDVLDEHGQIKDPAYIHGCLHHILSDSREVPEVSLCAGALMDRNAWAKLRQQVIDAGNEEALRLIDTAVFSMSLDDTALGSDYDTTFHTYLHNYGKNRWYDKSFQVLVTKDGKSTINFEHSWGDGVAVLRCVNEIFKDSINKPFIHPTSLPASIESRLVRCLDLKYTPQIKEELRSALENFNSTVSKHLTFDVMQYMGFGKDLIKKKKLSPDAVMQLAFQMAYYKQNEHVAASYESCSTAAFKHGRTETIRPATTATLKCSQGFLKNDVSRQDRLKLIEECSALHGALTKDAALGKGFDRHLFVLRTLAEEKNAKIPELFQDPAYKKLNHIILSTSTLQSRALEVGGFGPVVPDGFGIAYMVQDAELACLISSYSNLKNGTSFRDCIESSLEDIHKVLAHTKD